MVIETENTDITIKARQVAIYNKITREYGPIENIDVNLLDFYFLKETLSYIDDKILQKEAKKQQYREFLLSPYWKIIRAYLIYTRKQCRICKKTDRLTIHHKNYKHFGIEYKYLDDLDVLCWKCHIRARKTDRVFLDPRTTEEIINDLKKWNDTHV